MSWLLGHVVKTAWLEIKRSISKIMTLQPGQQTITYPCCPISHEVKTTRQWNLVSQKDITREIFFFKNHGENEPGILVPDILLFLKNALYYVKASG